MAPWLVALAGHALEIPIVEYRRSDWITAQSFWYLFGTLDQYLFYNLWELPIWGLGVLVWVLLGVAAFAFFRTRRVLPARRVRNHVPVGERDRLSEPPTRRGPSSEN